MWRIWSLWTLVSLVRDNVPYPTVDGQACAGAMSGRGGSRHRSERSRFAPQFQTARRDCRHSGRYRPPGHGNRRSGWSGSCSKARSRRIWTADPDRAAGPGFRRQIGRLRPAQGFINAANLRQPGGDAKNLCAQGKHAVPRWGRGGVECRPDLWVHRDHPASGKQISVTRSAGAVSMGEFR